MEKEFWDKRWLEKQTGWDIGYPSPAIENYFKLISNQEVKILIPGCGNGYEAQFLFEEGFQNVWLIDISEHAVESFKKRVPKFPVKQVICGDFFELEDEFDFIIEQTFFCAIDPQRRDDYCQKMANMLKPTGKLVGLLFNFPLEAGPPFGGDKQEYKNRFSKTFSEVSIEECKTSIPPRMGREFWINMAKPLIK